MIKINNKKKKKKVKWQMTGKNKIWYSVRLKSSSNRNMRSKSVSETGLATWLRQKTK